MDGREGGGGGGQEHSLTWTKGYVLGKILRP